MRLRRKRDINPAAQFAAHCLSGPKTTTEPLPRRASSSTTTNIPWYSERDRSELTESAQRAAQAAGAAASQRYVQQKRRRRSSNGSGGTNSLDTVTKHATKNGSHSVRPMRKKHSVREAAPKARHHSCRPVCCQKPSTDTPVGQAGVRIRWRPLRGCALYCRRRKTHLNKSSATSLPRRSS